LETESRMITLRESFDGTRLPDVEFLKTANEQLIECWRVLKYTYVFTYYLTDQSKNMHRMNFADKQEQLERLVETLSELCEMPLDEMNRMQIVSQTFLVDVFMKKFLQFVDEDMKMNSQAP
jgi:ariadne-1